MQGHNPNAIEQTPGSMLEIYMHAIRNKTGDKLLDQINLGVGNYTEGEYWQQVDAFRSGLFADSTMTPVIIERAIEETKRAMVDAVFDDESARILDRVDHPAPEDGETRIEYRERCMDDVWDDLGFTTSEDEYTTEEHQAWLVNVCAGIPTDWVPPHWRMIKVRHEASRSKDGRLIDNLFGRPPEPDVQPMEDFR